MGNDPTANPVLYSNVPVVDEGGMRPPATNPAASSAPPLPHPPARHTQHAHESFDGVAGGVGRAPPLGLLAPPPNVPSSSGFRTSLFSEWCNPNGLCFMAWFCSCFPIAQIMGRVENAEASSKGAQLRDSKYKKVLAVSAVLFVANVFMGTNALGLFLLVVLYQARVKVRDMYGLARRPWEDCCVSCFCGPCSVLQLAHQLWSRPDETPGWDVSSRPCHQDCSRVRGDLEAGHDSHEHGHGSNLSQERMQYYESHNFQRQYAHGSVSESSTERWATSNAGHNVGHRGGEATQQPMYAQPPPPPVVAATVVSAEPYDAGAFASSYGHGR